MKLGNSGKFRMCRWHVDDMRMLSSWRADDMRMTYVVRQWQQFCIKPTGFLVFILQCMCSWKVRRSEMLIGIWNIPLLLYWIGQSLLCCERIVNMFKNILEGKGLFFVELRYWWLVRVTLVVCFWFLRRWWRPANGALSFYELNGGSEMGIPWGGVDTQTLPYAKEFVWTFCIHRWRGRKNFGLERCYSRATIVEVSQNLILICDMFQMRQNLTAVT